MNLLEMIYLIDIVSGIGVTATSINIFLGIGVGLWGLFYYMEHSEFNFDPFLVKLFSTIGVISLCLSILIPTKTTAYAMLSVHVIQKYATETGFEGLDKKVVELLKQKLEEMSKEKN